MNDLEKIFKENEGRLIHKWQHYFDIYDRHFSRFRGTDVHIVEFGVSQGGSLQMWKKYFGPKAKVYGIDINHHCKQLEEEQIEIIIGDQEDRVFLRSLIQKIPRIDILIDDGGHRMEQQIRTYEELFFHIDKNGVYLCEDLLTSYMAEFGGGYKSPSSFIEFSKNFIDDINAWHSKTSRHKITELTKTAQSLHYYDSILVIEKKPMEEPFHLMTGESTVPHFKLPMDLISRLKRRVLREVNCLKRRFS